MGDLEIRPLLDAEHRSSLNLFLRSMHRPPVDDAAWDAYAGTFEPGRTLGAFAGEELAGTALAWSSSLRVPGGDQLGMAAISRVGVRADHRRRGALTGLMRALLADAAERGEPLCGLQVSEPVIYGRFGFGLASRLDRVTVRADLARFHPGLPAGGRVRLVDGTREEIVDVLAPLHDRCAVGRTGAMVRARPMWDALFGWMERPLRAIVHTGPDGDDGAALFMSSRTPGSFGARLDVVDFVAADTGAAIGLWRFLLSIDLVREVFVFARPTDELVADMFVDPRAVTSRVSGDDLWLRLVDVERALRARSWACPLSIEVRDALLPGNSGVHRVSESGVERGGGAADIVVDVDVLSQLYLGATSATSLAGVGRLTAASPEALARADTAFALAETAYSGTSF
ncbi:GNAT family N-acetyltransferase [Actinokineospora pegani]|uniref:GNAT family N-acetyltransferase n=1 Tax=Actinokineospora pegani TaxID=2654637 RepID=UPI0018D2BC39|nr:GNAT family N-acetyltransferase [Actinokineospora pegani]